MSDVRLNKISDSIHRKVRLCGIKEIMFDRYAGDNNTKLEPWQKLYIQPGTRIVGIPAINIMSFLTAHNTNSAPKRLRDKRKYKDLCNSMLSFVMIGPSFIPLLKDGKPIEFDKFNHDDVCEKSGIYVHKTVARLDKGIPNPKERPVVPLPWSLEFDFELMPNKEIKEVEIQNIFEEGGRAIGLGTFRGLFGKFVIDMWE